MIALRNRCHIGQVTSCQTCGQPLTQPARSTRALLLRWRYTMTKED
jgi:hypothetical protein